MRSSMPGRRNEKVTSNRLTGSEAPGSAATGPRGVNVLVAQCDVRLLWSLLGVEVICYRAMNPARRYRIPDPMGSADPFRCHYRMSPQSLRSR